MWENQGAIQVFGVLSIVAIIYCIFDDLDWLFKLNLQMHASNKAIKILIVICTFWFTLR